MYKPSQKSSDNSCEPNKNVKLIPKGQNNQMLSSNSHLPKQPLHANLQGTPWCVFTS